ncbi:MAG: TonB-dependent receptor [Bacteroidota bacterium]
METTKNRRVRVWLLMGMMMALFSVPAFAQKTILRGTVKDEQGEPLHGASVYFQSSFQGQATDQSGNFTITASGNTPLVYVVSMVGFETLQDTIKQPGEYQVDLVMREAFLLGQEVVVSASMVEENIMTSTISVEKLDLRQIQQMPQANFYDGLYQLKGIDMNVQSLTFKVPNARGFNSNTNYRFNQIVDGVNSQAPGLNFAAGNIFGVPHLDVESVEFLSGASSALYGAGGMNGTLLIQSKDPFDYQGLSASVQVGAMNLNSPVGADASMYRDFNLRYSYAINDKLAIKLTGQIMDAQDWEAGDQRDKNFLDDPSKNRWNSSGYDGVNVYGDETAINLGLIAPAVAEGFAESQGFAPGTPEYEDAVNGILDIIPDDDVTRTGWEEKDLVNYDARNLKATASIHYKINDDTRAILQGTYGEGQAVYSAQNRFSINDFQLWNIKAEISNPDYMARYWYVKEDAGFTYDAGGLAALINEGWKSTEEWLEDYVAAFLIGSSIGQDNETAHGFARETADNRNASGNVINNEEPALPVPGSPEFNRLRDEITRTPVNAGGARVLDFSSMGQFEGRYNFSRLLNGTEILVGFQYRYFNSDSDGTIYPDTPGNPIVTRQFGGFIQYIEDFLDNRLKLNVSARVDKDTRFDLETTPRFSLAYTAGEKRNHHLRFSAQTAFRFPSLADQWTDLDVGTVRVVGGQAELQDTYGLRTEPTFPLIGTNPVFAVPDTTNGTFNIPTFRAERVFALEVGYRTLLGEKLYLDANIYRNDYSSFQGSQLLVQDPFTVDEQRFQTFVSTDQNIINWGWSLGGDYRLPKRFEIGGNVSYSTIEQDADLAGFQTRFNTPEYRFNVSFGNRRLLNRLGFNVNYRWQQAFLWESSFGVGEVDAFGSLDVVFTYSLPGIKSKIKLGGMNVLNDYYTTSFGSSSQGGLYYVTFIYDQLGL